MLGMLDEITSYVRKATKVDTSDDEKCFMWCKLAELNAFSDLSGLCGLSHKKEKHSGYKKRLCAVRLLERRPSLPARFAVENEVANRIRILEGTLVKEACNFVSASFLRRPKA